MELFFKGFILGFSVAAPIGPVGVLCINRTLNKGYDHGIATGMGAALVDLTYGLISAFGFAMVSSVLLEYEMGLKLFGACILLWLAIQTLNKKGVEVSKPVIGNKTLLMDGVSIYVMTITNPTPLLIYFSLFAGMGLSMEGTDYLTIGQFVFAVFLGSLIWWVILTTISYSFKNRLNDRVLRIVDVVSGSLLLGFGLWMVFDLIW
ncbi:LysE family translocator [Reichenbachiella versicolor]|uniref:LysE family translocator n=1 Tax=Reichenbachiella versicolor TaxID=1821036 RepID=UPI000D6DD158|nr:LysE family transporter [Reichenbachiella versicolor]